MPAGPSLRIQQRPVMLQALHQSKVSSPCKSNLRRVKPSDRRSNRLLPFPSRLSGRAVQELQAEHMFVPIQENTKICILYSLFFTDFCPKKVNETRYDDSYFSYKDNYPLHYFFVDAEDYCNDNYDGSTLPVLKTAATLEGNSKGWSGVKIRLSISLPNW